MTALRRGARAVATLLGCLLAGALLCLVYVTGDERRCQALRDDQSPRAAAHCPPADSQETSR